jgi:hypothetical protein
MTRRIILAMVVGWISSVAPAILAQTSVSSVPPGHEKLAVFVGKWVAEADFKPSKTSSGGKSNWTEACEWLEGNYALLCHSEGEFGGHPVKEVSVMAYDASQKTYVYFETNSSDESDVWRGKVEGDTWTWSERSMEHDKPSEMRFTQRFSADSIAFKLESAVGDTPFNVVMDGKQSRQK